MTNRVLIQDNYYGEIIDTVKPSEAKNWKTFQIDLQAASYLSIGDRTDGILNCLETQLERIEGLGYSILSAELVKQTTNTDKFRMCFLVIARKKDDEKS